LLTTIFSGSAAHGDYVFGWEGDSLQKAMDNNCNLNNACPKAGLTTQQPAQYNACKKKQQAPEDVDGCKYPVPLSLSLTPTIFYPLQTKPKTLTISQQGSRRCHLAPWPSRHRQDKSTASFDIATVLSL
jgi:hypothetical protein